MYFKAVGKKKKYATDYICINTWVLMEFVCAQVYAGEKQSRDVQGIVIIILVAPIRHLIFCVHFYITP